MSANIKPAASTALVLQDEGGTDVITISTAGNVGVGNGSPAEKLDVTGNINATGALTLGTALAIAEGGTGATTASGARTALDLEIGVDVEAYSATNADYADATANFTGTLQNGGSNVVVDSDIGSTVQAYDADLSAIAALSNADGNFIVGSATGWTVESGATARTSLGLGTLATQSTITESQISDLQSYITASSTDTLTNKTGAISQWTNDSGYLTSETNDLGSAVTGTLPIANGGTGQTTAAAARIALLPTLGTAGQVLAVNTGTTDVEWVDAASGGGSGTVTSVAISGTDGIEVDSGSPVTTSGTITLGVNAATLSSHLSLGTAATTAATDYATSAQGALADSAVQPNDNANTLGSGAATDGYVLTADGAGGSAWEAASGGGASLPIDLLSSGASIRKSDGTTAVLSESGGIVTLENVTNLIATSISTSQINVGANLAWNGSTDAYTANTTASSVTNIHLGMKRCVLNMDGNVNYYLNPSDSTQKLDGTSATLDGSDGYVMVEIPKFYFRYVLNGSTHNWEISDLPLAGYQLHPAFFKDGEIVDYRYISAYDSCMYDASAASYVSGTNLDDMTGSTDTANDKLASVSGIYPIVGLTRDECRSIAENNGTGWRVADFWLVSAIQMLYLVEYGDFYSQSILGAGNTNESYVGSSSNQSDSPHTVAGASNSWGNASTDGSQPSAGAKPGTAYMSYRGIENFFGNCWNWVDGINIGVDANYNVHVSNTTTHFADNTSTNYDLIGQCASANGYVQNISDIPGAFIPNDTTGASSSTYLTDYFYINTGNRVARFGGSASNGADAGAFCWAWNYVSSFADRSIGARVAY